MDVDTRTDAAVYAAHAHELVRFATGLIGPHDAPDVVADAFITLTAAPIWSAARDRRALWYRAVLLQARSWQRSAARRRRREQRAAGVTTVDFPDLRPEVAAAVARLSTQQRAVIVLTYWDDLAPADVAALLDISEGSVRKHLARDREQLRRVLA